MRFDFWRWYDRGARVDFGGTLVGFVFDWRGWISATIGGGGGAMTFLWAAIAERSALDVWVLAVVVIAALTAAIYFFIGALEKYLALRPSEMKPSGDVSQARTVGFAVSGRDNTFVDVESEGFDTGFELTDAASGNRIERVAARGSPISLDRIPVVELMKMATDRGWNFTDQHSLHLIDLQDAIRQGGLDGDITVWGKQNRWPNAEMLMRKEIIEKIPSGHWREFRVHLFAALENDNFHTYSWTVKPSSTTELNYVDLHVERSEARVWLDRQAATFKGKTTMDNRT